MICQSLFTKYYCTYLIIFAEMFYHLRLELFKTFKQSSIYYVTKFTSISVYILYNINSKIGCFWTSHFYLKMDDDCSFLYTVRGLSKTCLPIVECICYNPKFYVPCLSILAKSNVPCLPILEYSSCHPE